MESTFKQPEPNATNATEDDSTPERCCPHCRHRLTLREITFMMHGSGYEQYARVKLADGSIALVEAGIINPTLVEVLD